MTGGTGNDGLYGGTGDDNLNGGDGRDFLAGGEGNDELRGGNLGDTLFGDEGADTLYGNGGWDRLYGGEGDDVVRGGWGNGSLYGDYGVDTLSGGQGDDYLSGYYRGTNAGIDEDDDGDLLFAGDGDDVTLMGNNDYALGGSGNDTFETGTWINADSAPRIGDFDPAEDTLNIYYDVDTPPAGAPVAQLSATIADATEVLLDGNVVAILYDVTDPTLVTFATIGTEFAEAS